MGKKGAKLSQELIDYADGVVEQLFPLGDVRSRKMFGGFGIFEGETMFALIDSAGRLFLKVGASNMERFESAGSERHARMPYFAPPDEVKADPDALREWAQTSIAEAKLAKKK